MALPGNAVGGRESSLLKKDGGDLGSHNTCMMWAKTLQETCMDDIGRTFFCLWLPKKAVCRFVVLLCLFVSA